ncbi:MAG: pseudouridine-5'-phosphate glycosidase, partial [Blastocatellia bacterium]
VAPCPPSHAIARDQIDRAVTDALADAAESGVRGSAVTPFLLARVAASPGGRALAANLSLLENNARIAGRIAVSLDRGKARES